MIAPGLAHLAVPIGSLTNHPANPNEGDVGAVAVQLEAHGQHTPIVAQASTGLVLAGNHTLIAARALGWAELAAVMLDVDEGRALEILVGDNHPARLSKDDPERLRDVLVELAEADELAGSGYTPEDLDELIGRINRGPMPSWDVPVPVVTIRLPPSVFERWLLASAASPELSPGELLAELLHTHQRHNRRRGVDG